MELPAAARGILTVNSSHRGSYERSCRIAPVAVKLGVVMLPSPRPKTAGKHPFNHRGRVCPAIVHF
jgi:hypothetical protein